MNAYLYKADLHCEECGNSIKGILDCRDKAPADPTDENTFDSDDYLKGPYPNGGGESDSPQHCGTCGLFLENPLTTDGNNYVLECSHNGGVPESWADFYDYLDIPKRNVNKPIEIATIKLS